MTVNERNLCIPMQRLMKLVTDGTPVTTDRNSDVIFITYDVSCGGLRFYDVIAWYSKEICMRRRWRGIIVTVALKLVQISM
jgi:hypothetical protein